MQNTAPLHESLEDGGIKTNLGCRILAIQEVKNFIFFFYFTFGKYLNCLNTYNMHTHCFIGMYMYN